MATPFESNNWVDQWAPAADDEKQQQQQKPEKQSSKLADYNKKMKSAASTGVDKAKVAASSGAKKVKSGSASGFQWIKDIYHKKKTQNLNACKLDRSTAEAIVAVEDLLQASPLMIKSS